MSFPKFLVLLVLVLTGAIGLAYLKKQSTRNYEREIYVVSTEQPLTVEVMEPESGGGYALPPEEEPESLVTISPSDDPTLPEADRVAWLFNVGQPRLPIVKTITYSSKVPWLKGRAAWVSDYAGHYKTSRHFIARSLNGKADYFNQNVANGDRFNVFDEDKDVEFHLVCDLTRLKMWFYYHDKGADERVLLRTYDIGLGRPAPDAESKCLTPLGTYLLGDKVAVYKPKMMGWFNKERVEMIRVFGTRWIPFESEVAGNTQPARGFGIHGVPWKEVTSGQLEEDRSCIGAYSSDGCIRLHTSDMEELFAIVISRPTQIHLVRDFREVVLPGKERVF